ncbi:protease modulator HflC [Jannaschia seohaensis]|uniref:Membrane protease subunit HflC n=1 Tax=Jannaschia seohaensis TaxID=475081 RepID=A0A2Y9AQQ9_9RHOB|nr:protease modulator HflC [Jannaschia seohaensis]PWJ18209.1 membrane protease subunit HflC [Jannaschia seohaensis]SSA46734.1 membrane protease subunit HflC [Jannaschia seohaensis]
MKRSAFLLPVAAVVLVAIFSSLFVVDERQKALVLQFGRVVSVKEDPGLAFKLPLIQDVVFYDDRILSRDVDPLEVTPSDDRRLVVDAFARFRIADVERFRQSVGVGGIPAAELRLDSILRSELREVLGSVSSNEILSQDRAALMLRIATGARAEALALGLEIIDVRLKRTDLPPQNLDATFARMRAEREREAADEVARGEEAAQRIRAQADRTVVELTSDAGREAEIIRGEADARRNSIFAEAFTADPEFFEFYRSLTAYTRALQGSNSTLVLSPDSDFFNYLRTDRIGAGNIAAAPRAAAPAAQAPVPQDDASVAPETSPPTAPASSGEETGATSAAPDNAETPTAPIGN